MEVVEAATVVGGCCAQQRQPRGSSDSSSSGWHRSRSCPPASRLSSTRRPHTSPNYKKLLVNGCA
eukprot:4646377-Prymnesium_polylepis.8